MFVFDMFSFLSDVSKTNRYSNLFSHLFIHSFIAIKIELRKTMNFEIIKTKNIFMNRGITREKAENCSCFYTTTSDHREYNEI